MEQVAVTPPTLAGLTPSSLPQTPARNSQSNYVLSSGICMAEKLLHLLQPFEEATREASGEYSSAAVIIPVVNSLQRSLTTTAESTIDDHGIERMKQEMLSSLKQ